MMKVKRKYIVRVTSKLPAVHNQTLEVDFGTKGLKTFEKILKAAVDYFKSALMSVLTPPQLSRYRPEAASLVWVEGRKLVHPFSRRKLYVYHHQQSSIHFLKNRKHETYHY